MSVRAAFQNQARVCAEMGSPFTARLCALVAARLAPGSPVADQMLGWPGDPSNRADALPLRLAGALHGLVIEGRDPALAAVYPPHHAAVSDDQLWDTVQAACAAQSDHILRRLESPPQTNEVQRSAALCPGFLTIATLTGLPLVLSEIGASAGLNLMWDRFAYRFGHATWGDPASPVAIIPDWRGAAPPLASVTVAERAACDRAPVDLADPAARQRLLSFVWADQADRLARTRAAIALAQAAGVTVTAAPADAFLAERLAPSRPGAVHVVYHSIMWQYLDPSAQSRCLTLLEDAGARATADAPLAWLRLEDDGAAPGAGLTLTLWPGGSSQTLARADYHGRWVDWRGWSD